MKVKVKSKTTSKHTSSSSSVTRWLSTKSANSVEFLTVYWSSACKVHAYLVVGAPIVGLRETRFNSSDGRCRVWIENLKFLVLLSENDAWAELRSCSFLCRSYTVLVMGSLVSRTHSGITRWIHNCVNKINWKAELLVEFWIGLFCIAFSGRTGLSNLRCWLQNILDFNH